MTAAIGLIAIGAAYLAGRSKDATCPRCGGPAFSERAGPERVDCEPKRQSSTRFDDRGKAAMPSLTAPVQSGMPNPTTTPSCAGAGSTEHAAGDAATPCGSRYSGGRHHDTWHSQSCTRSLQQVGGGAGDAALSTGAVVDVHAQRVRIRSGRPQLAYLGASFCRPRGAADSATSSFVSAIDLNPFVSLPREYFSWSEIVAFDAARRTLFRVGIQPFAPSRLQWD